jgi:hypothetical protein
VTLKAVRVVCSETLSASGSDGGPCAALRKP